MICLVLVGCTAPIRRIHKHLPCHGRLLADRLLDGRSKVAGDGRIFKSATRRGYHQDGLVLTLVCVVEINARITISLGTLDSIECQLP